LQMKQTLTYACPASSYDAPFYAPKTPQTRGWLIFQGNSRLSSGHGLQFGLYNTSGDTGSTFLTSDFTVNTNAWYHVVGTYDGSSVVLYLNGESSSSSATSPIRPNGRNPMMFGLRGGGTQAYLPGKIDEAAFYTNSLSAAQILAHFQAGTNAAPSVPYPQVILNDNPVGYWRFDEH
jgi:hypothetical protein